MKTIFHIALAIGLVATSPAAPHKFEDGFVERTLAIVIRDNLATAQYSIALNESTLKDVLKQWRNSEAVDLGKSSDTPTNQANAPAKSATRPGDQSNELTPNTQTEPLLQSTGSNPDRPETETDANSEKEPEKPSAPIPTTAADESNTEHSDSDPVENPIDQDLLLALQKSGPSQIARQIIATCNGQILPIKNVSVSPAPRHPFNLAVKFEFEIPPVKSAKLHIEDRNFRQQTGAVRYALKTLGDTILIKSDAAPIVVRAQRRELAGLSKKEIRLRTSISAQIMLMSILEVKD